MAPTALDLADVRGQIGPKRTMEVAAAGGHHIVLVGPGGCGKSMLARAFVGLLPPLSSERLEEASVAHRAAGHIGQDVTLTERVVVTPAPSCSKASLVGGRGKAQLGDLALADRGLLVLDDAERFSQASLAIVREAIDREEVRHSTGTIWPTRFQLFATVRTCSCGGGFEFHSPCGRGSICQIDHQWGALKWFIDIADMQVTMPSNQPADWGNAREETSMSVLKRVTDARQRQYERGQVMNAELDAGAMKEVCALDAPSDRLLDDACCANVMSGRDRFATLRVARTLADLEGAAQLRRVHIAEALIYRFLRPRYEKVWG